MGAGTCTPSITPAVLLVRVKAMGSLFRRAPLVCRRLMWTAAVTYSGLAADGELAYGEGTTVTSVGIQGHGAVAVVCY